MGPALNLWLAARSQQPAAFKVFRSFADTFTTNKTGRAQIKGLQVKRIWEMLYVRCTRCKQPIDVGDHQTHLAREGKLIRLRCGDQSCRNDDWYSDAEFEGATAPAEISSPQAETHYHDILTSGIY